LKKGSFQIRIFHSHPFIDGREIITRQSLFMCATGFAGLSGFRLIFKLILG
jgi:hypothetical protein